MADRPARPARLAAQIPAPVVERARPLCDGGTPRTWSAGRCGTRCCGASAGGLGPRHRCPARPRSSALFPGAVLRERFGTVAVRRGRRGVRDHDLPARARLRGLPAAPPGGVRRRPRARTSPAATSRSTRWPGAAAAVGDARPTRPGRPVRRARRPASAGVLRAVGEPRRGFTRTRCGWSARSGWRRRSTSRSRPATLAAIEANAGAGRPRVGRARRRRAVAAAGGAAPVGRAARRGGHGPARRDRPGARGPARDRAEQGAGRGPVGPHAPHRGRRARRAAGSCGWPRCSTTSASRRRSPTAGSTTTTWSAPSRPRRSSAGSASRRPRSRTSPTSSTTTCSRSRRTGAEPAVRRFIRRIGREHVDALFELRRADDIGSGLPPDDPVTAAFRARIDAELAARPPLDRGALAVDGDDLIRDLGLEPGPRLGRVLDALLERVIARPGPQRPGHADAARTGHACRHAG